MKRLGWLDPSETNEKHFQGPVNQLRWVVLTLLSRGSGIAWWDGAGKGVGGEGGAVQQMREVTSGENVLQFALHYASFVRQRLLELLHELMLSIRFAGTVEGANVELGFDGDDRLWRWSMVQSVIVGFGNR
jgi:hypothetical protein